MTNGYIYLFKCVSDYETTYKIGYTRNKDFKKRIKGLQTGNKDKITCIDFFKTKYGRMVETTLHNLYSHKRKGGEWFELDLQDVVNFKLSCQKIEDNFKALELYNIILNK
ncbi:MAG: hypothetical protein HPY57_13990 [Ignavibacteria bacterium]|nr:hypothetical protein [Ignavibacteria bacterium]